MNHWAKKKTMNHESWRPNDSASTPNTKILWAELGIQVTDTDPESLKHKLAWAVYELYMVKFILVERSSLEFDIFFFSFFSLLESNTKKIKIKLVWN